MASHHITIAKASFVAACLRPDVTTLTRNDIDHFHSLLGDCLLNCSPRNVQNCREWLLVSIVPSPHRIAAFGKYLSSICKHLTRTTTADRAKGIPASRQRLHILYVVNDLFHHAKYHATDVSMQPNLEKGLESILWDLFQTAALESGVRVKRRLETVLKIWETHKYFSTTVLRSISTALTTGATTNPPNQPSKSSHPPRELPYIMPASHGDPSTPFYDLPAANLMPHIVPNAAIPMKPEQIKALQLSAGPADENLIRAVKEFLRDVDRLDDPFGSMSTESDAVETDQLGQLSYQNEDMEIGGDTYYGWSRSFCEKMKSRGRRTNNGSERSRSHSSQHKRRRRNSSRSWSRSRSSSPDRFRSRSRSPGRNEQRFDQRVTSMISNHQHVPLSDAFAGTIPPAAPFPLLGSNSVPIPPPRPADWKGPWPPPLPIYMHPGQPNMQIPFPSQSFPPPPPPPPPSQGFNRHPPF